MLNFYYIVKIEKALDWFNFFCAESALHVCSYVLNLWFCFCNVMSWCCFHPFQVNQATLVPNSLKTLQTTLHIRFDHFTIDETSKIAVADWNFYNAKWNNQNVVLSLSNKHLGPMKSLPTWITLYPLVKFTDIIPSRYLKDAETSGESNGRCSLRSCQLLMVSQHWRMHCCISDF